MIYIGAENIISPLGTSSEAHIQPLERNISGITSYPGSGFNGEELHLARIVDLPSEHKFEHLVLSAVSGLEGRLDERILTDHRTLLILSSTKGDLSQDLRNPFNGVVESLVSKLGLRHTPWVISNACVSGVLAVNVARDLLAARLYEHVIVVGCDVLSDFVIYGFQSLFALSAEACRPFDAGRKGVTLGEGCAVTVLSNSSDIFAQQPFEVLGGTGSNDANHISGPSRTGEGLYRTVLKTMQMAGVASDEIDYVSAHGTGTLYNDEMEAIAFNRLGLADVPLNSLKGYFGHTLGAAGVMETAIVLQSMRQGILYKSLGYAEPGTTGSLNLLTKNQTTGAVNTVLKTASGFGGCNASYIIRRI